MKLNPLQRTYKIDAMILLGQLGDLKWRLAYLAMKGKQDKIESWAEILSDLARNEPRTVREWAQAAEFRELVFKAHRKYIKLPYSFYAHASRKLDALPFDVILKLMLTYEEDKSAKLISFDGQLTTLAGAELPDYGGFPPSGYPIRDAIKDEFSRIKELSERSDMPAPVAGTLRAVCAMLDQTLTWWATAEAA